MNQDESRPDRPDISEGCRVEPGQLTGVEKRAATEERRRRRQLRQERELVSAGKQDKRPELTSMRLPVARSFVAPDNSAQPGVNAEGGEDLKQSRSNPVARNSQAQVQLLLQTALQNRISFEKSNAQRELELLASIPGPKSRKSRTGPSFWSFIACVVLPTILAALYYGVIASDQYVAEFRFAVTTAPSPSGSPTSTDASAMSMSSLFNGMGLGGSASAQNYIVADYIVSRQAIDDLRKSGLDPAKLYSRDTIDTLSRLRDPTSEEKLVDYWGKMVEATYDPISGLASAEVRAFSPQDAYALASGLVAESEQLVNRIASRAKVDAVRYAEQEVERSNRELSAVRTKLDSFRQANGTIEPNTGIVTSNVQVAATLRATLAGLETDYITLLSQKVADNSPSALTAKARIAATKQQITRVEQEVSTNDSDKSALAKVIADYERIDLDRQHSQAAVLAAMQLLDSARASAASQSFYLTPYVLPAMPHSARYPQRWFAVLAASLVAFAIWLVGTLVVRSLAIR